MKRSALALLVLLVLGLTACSGAVEPKAAADPANDGDHSTGVSSDDPTTTTEKVTTTTARPTTTSARPTTTTARPTTTTARPTTTTAPPITTTTAPPITVTGVVDGDTVDLSTGERVRIIGIDTPEADQCGYGDAAAHLSTWVLDKVVTVTPGARDDVDRYGRILRYLDVEGVDAGRQQIVAGLAIARYDSRDGYGGHPREADYVAVDASTPSISCAPPSTAATAPAAPPSSSGGSVFYKNCDAVRAAGAAPIHSGDPGYSSKLDRDGDGVGCE